MYDDQSINSFRPGLLRAVVHRIPGSTRTVVRRNVSFDNWYVLIRRAARRAARRLL